MYPTQPIEAWDVNFGSAPTAQDIKDPGTGKRVVVVGWSLTTDTAGTLKLFLGTDAAANRIVNLEVAANGGESRQFPAEFGIEGASGIVLKVTGPGVVRGTVYGFTQKVYTPS